MAKKWSVIGKDKKKVFIADGAGKTKTLLTPSGKCAKFKAELENGIAITNDNKRKFNEDGSVRELTQAQKAYRWGYRAALGEQAAIYKKKNGR